GDGWLADSPMGPVRVAFAKPNDLGVMDHDVTLPTGEVYHNPFRVVPNGDGSEVVFTLYRLPTMSDQDFENDAAMVLADLRRLKALLERSDGGDAGSDS
ncbi:MAG TPA: SRPBCC family protein, partial [Planctomycetota bacterium]|nr:SRPBCC family protein [Planctomycetota bacterium]